MNESEYEQFLAYLQENVGGIGPTRVENIREAFPDGQAFEEACRTAYETRDTTELQRIHGIGHGYALHKLAGVLARRQGWSGGAAEPTAFPVMSGSEFVEMLNE